MDAGGLTPALWRRCGEQNRQTGRSAAGFRYLFWLEARRQRRKAQKILEAAGEPDQTCQRAAVRLADPGAGGQKVSEWRSEQDIAVSAYYSWQRKAYQSRKILWRVLYCKRLSP